LDIDGQASCDLLLARLLRPDNGNIRSDQQKRECFGSSTSGGKFETEQRQIEAEQRRLSNPQNAQMEREFQECGGRMHGCEAAGNVWRAGECVGEIK